jgi:hypothetical protein
MRKDWMGYRGKDKRYKGLIIKFTVLSGKNRLNTAGK